MILTPLDWLVIAAYFALNLAIGFFYMKRASGDIGEFFLSGRNVSWWLAGTSMVATTFGADTPLVVTGLIYAQGIAGNWLWWSFLLSGMLTVFFFAPLWRRARVLTDMEFAELRYAGPPATFLRGFRAVYLAFPVNTIILGWVNLAMAKILALTLGLTTTRQQLTGVFCCLALTLAYNAVSGLWAVLWTDLFQFILKMSMVILLAYFAVHAIGGMHSLATQVHAFDAAHSTLAAPRDTLAFIPSSASPFFLSFLVLLSLNWWASWYPGAEPGGGGYIAQRIFSAKNEKHSLGATLWFNIAHYALRPWPWILTALVALVLLPNPTATQGGMEGAYVWVMVHYLPPSLRGLMLAGFAAAYMSTVGTHLNLGASYMINDIYKRFFAPNRSARHYVAASRIATILVAVMSAAATGFMLTHGASIATAWKFLLSLGAGAGLVFILRWYWWRINAWSEIAAMTAAAAISLTLESNLGMPAVRALHRIDPALALVPLNQDDPHAFAWLMLTTTLLTTAIWLAVTLLTQPETEPTLQAFYDRVRPAALGWRRFALASGCPIHRAVVLRDGWESPPQTPEGQPEFNGRHPERSAQSGSPASLLAGVKQREVEGPPHFVRENEGRHPERSASREVEEPRETSLPHGIPSLSTNESETSIEPPRQPVDRENDPTLRYNFFHWILGFTLVYAMLFGVGDLLFARIAPGCALLTLSAVCLALLFYSLNRRGWSVWR
ncbi:MAG: sodium:solute symporter family protein [Acidobacteriaceae bacterium]